MSTKRKRDSPATNGIDTGDDVANEKTATSSRKSEPVSSSRPVFDASMRKPKYEDDDAFRVVGCESSVCGMEVNRQESEARTMGDGVLRVSAENGEREREREE